MIILYKAAYNFEYDTIGKYDECPENYYKVDLVIDSTPINSDFHWYHQNSNGTWSHKLRNFPVSKYDYNGNIIFNPKNCDRRSLSNNYTKFIGFYQIKLNNQ